MTGADQLAAARAVTLANRRRTAALKERVARGELAFADALTAPDAQRCRVEALLRARPGIGRFRAASIIEKVGLPLTARCGELDADQIGALLAAVPSRRCRPAAPASTILVERAGETNPSTVAGRLRVQEAERRALDRMTAAEREFACRRGELSSYQRSLLATYVDPVTFTDRRGEEVTLSRAVPQVGLINGELPWIAATLADNDPD